MHQKFNFKTSDAFFTFCFYKFQRQQLLDIACGTSARTESVVIDNKLHNMEKVQSSGSNQKMADAINDYVDLENDTNGIKELIEKRDEIIKNIEKLNTVEYDVLHKLYVQNMDLIEIAESYDKSYSWATSTHGRALKNLQKIMKKEK